MEETKQYYIDQIVLSLLMGLDEEEAIQAAYSQYLEELNTFIKRIVFIFVDQSQISEEQKNIVKQRIEETVFNDTNLDEKLNEPADDDMQKLLDNEALQKKVKEMVNLFNKAIYVKYQEEMSTQKRDILNDYLKKTESIMKTRMDTLVNLLNLVNEANEKIDSVDIASKIKSSNVADNGAQKDATGDLTSRVIAQRQGDKSQTGIKENSDSKQTPTEDSGKRSSDTNVNLSKV
ncbi:hypothetical protein GF389_05995 [Candidatus Dojkabacteria bacterium]|nr:hypothetical protein [Candidatus Dojkabacteria bacterium]